MNTTHTKWQAAFFSIWIGQQLSLMGISVTQFALVWWLTETTGSATVLAIGTLVSLLPSVLLGPLLGALVDRWNRRRVMIVADGLIVVASVWLAYLFGSKTVPVGSVYAMMLVRGIGGVFHRPAMQASTSLMVPEKHLSQIAGLNQAMEGLVGILSPPLGALLLASLSMHWIMAIDVVAAALAIGPLLWVHIPQPQRDALGSEPSVWADVRAGLRFIWRWPGLLMMLGGAALINFFLWPAFSLVPILVDGHFGGGALQLGWMNAAWSVGLLLGGALLSVWGGFRRRIATAILGLLGIGVSTLFVGLMPATAFWFGVAGLSVVALMIALTNGPVFALLQALVPPEMQARVFTVVQSVSAAMAPLGMAVAGPVADVYGVRVWYIVGGIACALIGAIYRFVPAVTQLEDRYRAPISVE